jgi:hypothetical protein
MHIDNIIARIQGRWTECIKPIKDLAKDAGIDASEWAVQRALKRRGYSKRTAQRAPHIRPAQAAKRLQFRIKHLAKPDNWLQHVVFTDEASFSTLLNGKAKVLRKKGERDAPECIQHTHNSGRGSFMVWGAIGYGWKSELVFLRPSGKRGVTAKSYDEQVLDAHLGPIAGWATEFDPQTFVIGDNAPVHSRKATQATRLRYKINSIDWPPSSPDFNAIETVWRIIKQRLRRRRNRAVQQRQNLPVHKNSVTQKS